MLRRKSRLNRISHEFAREKDLGRLLLNWGGAEETDDANVAEIFVCTIVVLEWGSNWGLVGLDGRTQLLSSSSSFFFFDVCLQQQYPYPHFSSTSPIV